MYMKKLLSILILLVPVWAFSQSSTLRGIVLDMQSETPLIGATLRTVGIEPALAAQTDADGQFTIKNVPVGRLTLSISYLGYETQTIPNILVTAGKEAQLDIRLQESFTTMNEVVITAKTDKDKPMNELSTLSARQFNTEEVSRYSGGRNDVAKLVTNFAGVATSNDSRNDIVIRGNSPTGVLWRLEGLPIPSPNHFATLGTTGGPVSALNPNMIANSDFLTGAFTAEYGNALAGVFDINMRTGNKDRFEFMGQMGAFTGLEAMIEGPMNKSKDGSFVVAYRHSFVEIADAAGLNVGTTALPRYKDASFNLDFGKSKLGRFSVFGIAAHSNIDFIGPELDSADLWASRNENAYSESLFGVLGLRHNVLLNDHSYMRTTLSTSYAGTRYKEEYLQYNEVTNLEKLNVRDDNTQFRFSTFYNNKVNKRLTVRTGVLLQQQNLDTQVGTLENIPDSDGDGLPDWVSLRDFDGSFLMTEAYAQTQYRLTDRLTLNTGVHAQHFDLTDDLAVEPRVALNWQVAPRSRINLGYGLHHQAQPLPVFLYRKRLADGTTVPTNNNLKFTRNQHFVLGYDFKPATDWRIKAEAYYQLLSDVPVDAQSSSFSMLNTGADFVFPEKSDLVNEGTGTNYGIELTVEKFFSKGYYVLLTTSLYESKYKGSDGIERNTAFNGNYVFNALAGREFRIGDSGRRFLTFDTKFTTAGGRPYTPVDLAASQAANTEVLNDMEAFTLRHDAYLRWDVKFGFRINSSRRKMSQTFFLDLQNVTNNRNIFAMRYNEERGTVGRVDQIGFFPDLMYRIEF
jgi:CarboxypepD_reg-like domain/TonB-dependent Receptor Plug Domain